MVGLLAVWSDDFPDKGALDPRHSANAWGQCHGENLNPHVAWSKQPAGTRSCAIVVVDRSAHDFVHWIHADIPAAVSSVRTGLSASLRGVAGLNGAGLVGYFGPCPPTPGHRYEFGIWALEARLGLAPGFTYANLVAAAKRRILARGSVTGIFPGPAGPPPPITVP